MITRVGGPTKPQDLDIDRETFRHVMMTAKDLRPRYAITMHAYKHGCLERYVDKIVSEYYD